MGIAFARGAWPDATFGAAVLCCRTSAGYSSGMACCWAFVDTNVLLHHRRLIELPWRDLVGSDEVRVVVAHVVVRELDRQKFDHPLGKIRRRAQTVLQDLEAHALVEPPANVASVSVELQPVMPRIDFERRGLAAGIGDDWLVGSILGFSDEFPDRRVVLLTADVGLRLKARHFGIETVSMPAELRLADEADPEEKERRRLEEQLRALQRSVPELTLVFNATEESQVKIDRPHVERWTEAAVENELRRERTALESPRDPLALAALGWIMPERVEAYLQRYEAHLRGVRAAEGFLGRSLEIRLRLMNSGTAPADDMDVFVTLPKGVTACREDGVPQPSKRPERPAPSLLALPPFPVEPVLPDLRGVVDQIGANASGPSIRDGDPAEVAFHVRRLKHNFGQPLDPIFVSFKSRDDMRSFSMPYRVFAGCLPDPVVGELHVHVVDPQQTSNAP